MLDRLCGIWGISALVILAARVCFCLPVTPLERGAAWGASSRPEPAHNLILFIGDGMGFEQVKAAGMFRYGASGTLSFESFPYRAEVTTHAADSDIPDSAATGTAIATGRKVNLGVVSLAIPGDRSELLTVLEFMQACGKSTGLVTTTYMTHVTPACFAAHEPWRGNTRNIAHDYLFQTRPNVLFGGRAPYDLGITAASAEAAGYRVVADSTGLFSLDTETASRVSGQFWPSHLPYEYPHYPESVPHLWEMTDVALRILDNDPDGFFLMVEGGRIDHCCHLEGIECVVHETVAFDDAVQTAVDWADGREDTLIVVTADHETGGLQVVRNNGMGEYPEVTWDPPVNGARVHTGVDVPAYAWGRNAQMVSGTIDNTGFFRIFTAGVMQNDRSNINQDRSVDFLDLLILLNDWYKTSGP